jgi:transcriptional regulator GlxA family with amidase domain
MERLPAREPTESVRKAAMDKVIELLKQKEGKPLSIADLLHATGVSERTLRSHFMERFGVGPHRYLHIRRMHLIRASLAIAEASYETVSSVANRFGYADAGRMAADYLEMFGEYPHQTLERHPSE